MFRLKKTRRIFDEILSEGQGKQLLWLIGAILFVLMVFWAILAFGIRDENLKWQDVLALMLDAGTFGGHRSHDFFRLLVTLCGMFLFSALLISVISNIFENIADSFRKGRSRYSHKDHILILGGQHHLFSILSALLEADSPYPEEDIVVLTNQDVESLRERVYSLPSLDKEKERMLRQRLTIYLGERDHENTLGRKQLAANAKTIYIIGEDDEKDGDSISLRCYDTLKKVCGEKGGIIRCFLLLQDPSSIKVFKRVKGTEGSSRLKIDMIDTNEYLAERVLIPDNHQYPSIDYTITRDGDGHILMSEGIREGCTSFVHFVIAGMTDIARALALTAAHICHFPNYRERGIRTVITFVDTDMALKMNRFIATFPNLFQLSHYRFVSFDINASRSHTPDPAYGDFLDIEWEFIDADITDPRVRSMLETWAADDRQSLSFAICQAQQKDNALLALGLPDILYRNGYPIFVHQRASDEILKLAREAQPFRNIHTFGSLYDVNSDPLFIKRVLGGQRVNWVYEKADNKDHDLQDAFTVWFYRSEANKLNSIYSANSMAVLSHNFGLLDRDLSTLTDEQWIPICDEEHRRWMISTLILGYSAPDKETLHAWTALANSPDTEKQADTIKCGLKKDFLHLNIAPFDDLPKKDQTTDKVIVKQIRYILLGE